MRVVVTLDFGVCIPTDDLKKFEDAGFDIYDGIVHDGVCGGWYEDEKGKSRWYIYVNEGHRSLTYGYDVEVPVLRLSSVAGPEKTEEMALVLKDFCVKYELTPLTTPDWMVVSRWT